MKAGTKTMLIGGGIVLAVGAGIWFLVGYVSGSGGSGSGATTSSGGLNVDTGSKTVDEVVNQETDPESTAGYVLDAAGTALAGSMGILPLVGYTAYQNYQSIKEWWYS